MMMDKYRGQVYSNHVKTIVDEGDNSFDNLPNQFTSLNAKSIVHGRNQSYYNTNSMCTPKEDFVRDGAPLSYEDTDTAHEYLSGGGVKDNSIPRMKVTAPEVQLFENGRRNTDDEPTTDEENEEAKKPERGNKKNLDSKFENLA